tara:strand:+ start:34387 stop:34686 length:300 start_codon:yes stop_codon:yes gene_type:complete
MAIKRIWHTYRTEAGSLGKSIKFKKGKQWTTNRIKNAKHVKDVDGTLKINHHLILRASAKRKPNNESVENNKNNKRNNSNYSWYINNIINCSNNRICFI